MASSCRLHELPLCAFVGLLGVLVDTPAIGIVALCKMPIMLYKGWRRFLGDLFTRNGSCLEAACVPLAGLAILFWPLVVVVSALTAFLCSPFFGLYSAVVVYQVCNFVSSLFLFCDSPKFHGLVYIFVLPLLKFSKKVKSISESFLVHQFQTQIFRIVIKYGLSWQVLNLESFHPVCRKCLTNAG